MGADLAGRRVLVVGASSGIGRAIAQEAVRAGGDVVFSARRVDKLETAVRDAGGGRIVAADMRVPDDRRRLVEDSVAALGGLDLLVYASAVMPYVLTERQTPDSWQELFETNTVGALMVMAAATHHIGPDGLIAYIGSDSVGAPYNGLVPYGVTKAGLDEGVRGLRVEYPDRRFCRVAVGPTLGTDIALGVDATLQSELLPELLRNARLTERLLDAPDLGLLVIELLAPALAHAGADVEEILIRPPGGPIPWGIDIDIIRQGIAGFTEQPTDVPTP